MARHDYQIIEYEFGDIPSTRKRKVPLFSIMAVIAAIIVMVCVPVKCIAYAEADEPRNQCTLRQ